MWVIAWSTSGSKFMEEGGTTRNLNFIYIFNLFSLIVQGRQMPKKCRVELQHPDIDWQKSFYLSRLRGLTSAIRSFCFKMLHGLLPLNERLHKMLPNNTSLCTQCPAQTNESRLHAFFFCQRNSLASQDLLSLISHYDSNITPGKAVLLDIHSVQDIYEAPVMLILATGMAFIFQNRQQKKVTTPIQLRAEIECLSSLIISTKT